MNKIKAWFKNAWYKTKLWVIGLLASIGVIVGAYAVPQGFTWTNPTSYVDGSPLDPSEIAETRLYCDGDTSPTISVTGSATDVTGDFGFGSHTCYATTVDIYGGESGPSNFVDFTITRPLPNPPVLSIN